MVLIVLDICNRFDFLKYVIEFKMFVNGIGGIIFFILVEWYWYYRKCIYGFVNK